MRTYSGKVGDHMFLKNKKQHQSAQASTIKKRWMMSGSYPPTHKKTSVGTGIDNIKEMDGYMRVF